MYLHLCDVVPRTTAVPMVDCPIVYTQHKCIIWYYFFAICFQWKYNLLVIKVRLSTLPCINSVILCMTIYAMSALNPKYIFCTFKITQILNEVVYRIVNSFWWNSQGPLKLIAWLWLPLLWWYEFSADPYVIFKIPMYFTAALIQSHGCLSLFQ